MSNVVMVTENGEQHGLINILPNSVKEERGFGDMTPETKAKAEKIRKDEARMVKARYINHRGMHERLSRPYMRYAGDAIKMYHLIPGHVYELPFGFVKEINESPGLAQRSEQVIGEQVTKKDRSPMKIHELVPISF